MLSTSLKGPLDPISSVPPQFIPSNPTLANYERVLGALPIPKFFLNSVIVSVSVGLLNVLVAALAAYPLAKMRFPGRSAIFYMLLATLIVPAQLTYIPSFVLAVNVFHYYDTLPALIFPNLVSAFNIFLLRQAYRGVPNDLLDAGRVDGASEWRIWWQIVLPVVRPSLAAVAIFTFVTTWNDFLWPSLMLHTRDGMTLPVGPRRPPGLLLGGLPLDRRRGDDDGGPDPAVLHRRAALLRARPDGRGQGLTRLGDAGDPLDPLGRLMLAFDGHELPDDVGRRFATAPAAGMTLFRFFNSGSPAQVRELTAAVQRAASAFDPSAPPLLIAADQEGGQLDALGGATPFPGNMALGAAGDEDLAERVGRATGLELLAMGANVSYAPVCDLADNPANPHIGIRSFGSEPADVARLSAADRARPARLGDRGRRQALPGPRRLGPRHAPRAGGGRPRPGEARPRRAGPVPGRDRGGRRGRDVGAPRAPGGHRRRLPAGDPVAGRHARPDPRRPRLPGAHDHGRPQHGGAPAGRRPGDRRDRGHPRGRRPAADDGRSRGPGADRGRAAARRGARAVRCRRHAGVRRADPRAPAAAGRGRAAADRGRPIRRPRGAGAGGRGALGHAGPRRRRAAAAPPARRRARRRRAARAARPHAGGHVVVRAAAARGGDPAPSSAHRGDRGPGRRRLRGNPGGDRGCGPARARHRQRLAGSGAGRPRQRAARDSASPR